MLLLLDTSILVDAERTEGELDDLIGDADQPALAAITIAGLGVGVDIATGRRKKRRQDFLDQLIELLPVLPYDLATASAHRALLVSVRKAGRPRGAHDLMIAATAVATGRTVVTGDASGFVDLPGLTVRSA